MEEMYKFVHNAKLPIDWWDYFAHAIHSFKELGGKIISELDLAIRLVL